MKCLSCAADVHSLDLTLQVKDELTWQTVESCGPIILDSLVLFLWMLEGRVANSWAAWLSIRMISRGPSSEGVFFKKTCRPFILKNTLNEKGMFWNETEFPCKKSCTLLSSCYLTPRCWQPLTSREQNLETSLCYDAWNLLIILILSRISIPGQRLHGHEPPGVSKDVCGRQRSRTANFIIRYIDERKPYNSNQSPK